MAPAYVARANTTNMMNLLIFLTDFNIPLNYASFLEHVIERRTVTSR